MAEERDRAIPDRQAVWVALRTLRQRPAVVGHTDEGTTVYEIRSVRLVLPPGSGRFRRLVPCARCGREVPGAFVLTQADLDHPPNAVFCECVRTPDPQRPQEEAAPALVRKPAPQALSRAEPAPPAVDIREELQQLSQRVSEVLRSQEAELEKLSATVIEVRAEMRELSSRLASQAEEDRSPDIEATVTRQIADVRAGVAAVVDARAQPLQVALADGLDQLRGEMAGLKQRIDEESAARSAVAQLAEAHRQLDLRVGELAVRTEASPAEDEARLVQEVADVRDDLAATVDADGMRLRAELADGFQRLEAEIASLERRHRDELGEIAALLDVQRKEFTEALHDVAHETLMSVAEPLRDLTGAREEFERRLESLQQRAQDDQRRLAALYATTSAGASRLRALEQRLQVPVHDLVHPVDGSEEPPAPQVQRRAPGALIESLERQLRDAEERLSER